MRRGLAMRSVFRCLPASRRHLAKLFRMPLLDIVRRYARTHGPFTTIEFAKRYGLSNATVESVLQQLVGMGRVVEGGFRPGGVNREWIDTEALRTIRRRSLAKLRKEIEPVEQRTLARLFTRWQGVVQPRRGLDALLDVSRAFKGAALPASLLETEIIPARILGHTTSDLDTLIAAGEVVWAGLEPLGERDGRVALYLADRLPILWPPDRSCRTMREEPSGRATQSAEQAIVATSHAMGRHFSAVARRCRRRIFRRDDRRALVTGLAWPRDERFAECTSCVL